MPDRAPFTTADYNRVFHALERAIYPDGPATMIDPEADPVVVRSTRAVFEALART